MNIKTNEIIYTSGSTESNNIALIGTAFAKKKQGNHIIVSKLEHESIYGICKYLEENGFIIDYVNNTKDGLIDFDDLKSLVTKDTILVSICAVNSELGIRQPLKIIKQIIKKENSDCVFHSDMTQALGKCPINLFPFFIFNCIIVLFNVSIFFSSICAFACSNVILSSTNNEAIEFINPILPLSEL